MKYTFRFDDISVNTDAAKLTKMVAFLRSTFSTDKLTIMFAVSPAVYDVAVSDDVLSRERTFPAMLHTKSDFRVFYRVERVGIPAFLKPYELNGDVVLAAHGMAHVDHRLLKRSAQEMSIVMSCSLLRTQFFVPPFHKWNSKTEEICREQNITLIKFDPTWRHLAYHKFDRRITNWYFHTHDFHYQDFCARFT